MTTTIHNAFLPHTDSKASLAFYRDTLGFELRNDVEHAGMHWLTLGPAGQPETSLVLYPPEADPGITDQERQVIAELMAKGSFAMLTLASDDLETLFDKLQSGDTEIVQEPTDQFYGVRDCAVRDPSGNLIRINAVS